jgi:hypothetical protein
VRVAAEAAPALVDLTKKDEISHDTRWRLVHAVNGEHTAELVALTLVHSSIAVGMHADDGAVTDSQRTWGGG